MNGYGSRKFIVTMYSVSIAAAILLLTMFVKVEDGFHGALSAFFVLCAAAIGAYNWANVKHADNNGGAAG